MNIISEIGWNHMGDMDLAEKMIKESKNSGSDTVKFQYWDPQYLTNGEWDNDGRREIYNQAALNKEKIKFLIECSKENSQEFLISVFGTKGAKFILNLGEKNIKIPSHETTNTKLIEFCSKNFEKIFFSSGASTSDEILRAVEIMSKGNAEFCLMHCVSSYPCDEDQINLKRINWLKTLCSEVGLSDHTSSTVIPAISVCLGAEVIEKHFTIDNNLPGRDNKFALEPNNFTEMVKNIKSALDSMNDLGIENQEIEQDTMKNYRGRWEPHDYT
tara:strand:+ start:204 stop:1019 length:816 start_codon:yes stop_codon:yes gene_type:complete